MRTPIAIAFAALSIAVGGCCRPWQTSAAEPPLPPREYSQGAYSDSYEPQPPSDRYDYAPDPRYRRSEPPNPYGVSPSSRGQTQYPYEAR